jgi:hypothetical protein
MNLRLHFFAGILSIFFMHPLPAADRAAAWAEVDQAVAYGLPRSAIEKLQPIITAAKQERAWAEATKAIARKIALEGTIEGNRPEEKITRLQVELAAAPAEMKPVLETLIAHWYWHYFQQNRWRFLQRTQTGEPPGDDFTTWDLPRLFAEIDLRFARALSAADYLKRTPINTWDDLIEKGAYPDTYRPTLYDFLAHEALSFYTAGEQAGAKAESEFELTAETPALAPVEEFLRWDVLAAAGAGRAQRVGDSLSPLRVPSSARALAIYRALLDLHRNDTNKSAFLDADLARLAFAWNTATGETRHVRFKAALENFIADWADHEVSAHARWYLARLAKEQDDDWVKAREIALTGKGAFPNSVGGKLCHNLIAEIEAREVRILTERVWNAPWPEIEVHYRNVTNVWFRAVAYDWDLFLNRDRPRPERLNDAGRRELLAKAPALEWSRTLPDTTDFKQTTIGLPSPATLAPGFYFIVASHNADFSAADNVVSYTPVWVSDLALILRPRAGRFEGFVLDALSGEPVVGATVQGWYLDQNQNRREVPSATTDEHGQFGFDERPDRRGLLVRVKHGTREVAAEQDWWWSNEISWHVAERTIFFTDRALYRPGQTIQYKGICLRSDPQRDGYELLKNRTVTVVFRDVNGQEVSRQTRPVNDFGSFSGSFTAPTGRLTGNMSIQVDQGPHGATMFSVEEYKRPKFQVELAKSEQAFRLNDTVKLTGKATAYTGAAIDGAKVQWRVVREVRFPIWWGWYRGGNWNAPDSKEIAHGTLTTAVNGSFEIEFVADPDRSVAEADDPRFHYAVYADVTDTAGETRSAQTTVTVGYTALEVNVASDDWLPASRPVALRLRTTTLDGQPLAAEGTLKVHRLVEPETVPRPLIGELSRYRRGAPVGRRDLSDPKNWELGEVVLEQGFTTGGDGTTTNSLSLAAGVYRVVIETQDRYGKAVKALHPLQVIDPEAPKLATKIPFLLKAPKWSLEPGEELAALWGTGHDTGRAFVEIEHRHRIVKKFWTETGLTQQRIRQAVDESLRGGFTLHVTMVRENRAYLESRRVEVPWTNKELELSWEHFTSKLEPGQKETWTLVVKPRPAAVGADVRRLTSDQATNTETGDQRLITAAPTSERVAAELVATLYDASLEQFREHGWQQRFDIFRQDYSTAQPDFQNGTRWLQQILGGWRTEYVGVDQRHRQFPAELVQNLWNRRVFRARGGEPQVVYSMAPPARMELAASVEEPKVANKASADFFLEGSARGSGGPPAVDLSQVTARKNLNETAFFFPQLTSDTNGVVRLTFTMPEALTEWRFLAFAHDRDLRSGYLEAKTVTSKDIMVQPNPPRFVREGDELEFTVKVSNQSAARQTGKVKLTFGQSASGILPDSGSSIGPSATDELLGLRKPEQAFDIPSKESRTFSWRIKMPDGLGLLTYKAVGSTGRISDGEEGYLPVLSRRVFLTESLPLPIRGPGERKFTFTSLKNNSRSRTLAHESLTVQMVSNPAWYAVLALPYLMEFPHECTEQTFNRFYANALARHIADGDPKIRAVFDQWKNTPALDSPLEKNADLKSVLLEETPWVRQAKNESEARRNVGVLFDANRLANEQSATLAKLAQIQLEDGRWSWFPGGWANDYITLYITTGFGRLRHLGADVDVGPAVKALLRLDQWAREEYDRIQKLPKPEDYVPSPTICLYLYGRSFFLTDLVVTAAHQPALDFFLGQARKHWLKTDNRQSQGQLAIALKRFGDLATPTAIMRSLKERSVTDDELGRFWRDTELSWWWYRAPIETQALMIEAFDEVAGDAAAVEECQVWLLKQKQTQDWKTTKATADAVYALLLRGTDLLASDALVEVSLGGKSVTPVGADVRRLNSNVRTNEGSRNQSLVTSAPTMPEAGTGFYEVRLQPADISAKLADVTVKKSDAGVAWGAVHWQYFEDISKVKPFAGTPLKLEKKLFQRVNTARGPELQPVRGALAVGDELVVRIELRVDRDMEYVHLKDQRGSGTEPVNVLSGYRYQDGLRYYESTRDTASHFFIDYLPKGAYVFEYATRVQLRGEYQTGVASIQCMYAPEFNSHSGSLVLKVR